VPSGEKLAPTGRKAYLKLAFCALHAAVATPTYGFPKP
jgi:hypothetical protein